MKSKIAIAAGLLWATSLSHAATVAVFTGGDVGEGIDFSGTVVYALNLAGNGNGLTAAPDLVVSGVTFKDTFNGAFTNPNILVNFQAINDWVAKPSYGASANDDNLEELMFDVAHGPNQPTVEFTSLTPNQLYRVQVLASDNSLSATRGTSYQLITGDLATGIVADQSLNNSLTTLQGDRTKGVVVTLEGFSDNLGRLSFRTPDATGFGDPNGIANALILTAVPEPSVALLGGLGLLALLRRRRA